jgi:outer membrane protein OmpA-like peptidoglycan-associated protein
MPQSKKILQNVVELLKAYPKNKILVEGHTDSVGSDEYNLKLSQLRANEVKKFLVENGIEEERIEAKGYGKSKPIASNKTEQGRAQNRRVEILIFK